MPSWKINESNGWPHEIKIFFLIIILLPLLLLLLRCAGRGLLSHII